MDKKHLLVLARRAGLQLEEKEMPGLLQDIQVLEDLVGTLELETDSPALTHPGEHAEAMPPTMAPHDVQQVHKNAMMDAQGFFRIPGVAHRKEL